MSEEERENLNRCIKKLKRRVNYLERQIENKNQFIKELEDIEDNKLIIYLRHIKEEEIKYFDYSCTLNNENLLEYHITIKREFKGDKE